METRLSISNRALSLCGANSLTDFDKDETPNARLVRQQFDSTLKQALSVHEWGFCSAYISPALVSDNDNIKDSTGGQWTNAFQQPTNLLQIRKVYNENELTDYDIGVHNDRKVIFANVKVVALLYTIDITDVDKLPQYFTQYLEYALALVLYLNIKGNDRYYSGFVNQVNQILQNAIRTDNKQSRKTIESDNTIWINARG